MVLEVGSPTIWTVQLKDGRGPLLSVKQPLTHAFSLTKVLEVYRELSISILLYRLCSHVCRVQAQVQIISKYHVNAKSYLHA